MVEVHIDRQCSGTRLSLIMFQRNNQQATGTEIHMYLVSLCTPLSSVASRSWEGLRCFGSALCARVDSPAAASTPSQRPNCLLKDGRPALLPGTTLLFSADSPCVGRNLCQVLDQRQQQKQLREPLSPHCVTHYKDAEVLVVQEHQIDGWQTDATPRLESGSELRSNTSLRPVPGGSE